MICAELPQDARPDEVRRFFESVGAIRECRVMKGIFCLQARHTGHRTAHFFFARLRFYRV